MSVPDTNIFKLSDVSNELGLGGISSLGDCFNNAISDAFDSGYKGLKDRLSNFRNYSADGWLISTAEQKTYYADYLPNAETMFFKPDGSKIYYITSGNYVVSWDLSTNWDITTMNNSDSKYISTGSSDIRGLFFKPDGSVLYTIEYYDSTFHKNHIRSHSLSTNWDISTISLYVDSIDITNEVSDPSSIFFSPDGKYMYTSNIDNKMLYQYTLSILWDITSATLTRSKLPTLPASVDISVQPFFSPDGKYVYIVSTDLFNAYKAIRQYSLSTAWDISLLTYISDFDYISGWISGLIAYWIDKTGTKLYINAVDGDFHYRFYQYKVYRTALTAISDTDPLPATDGSAIVTVTTGSNAWSVSSSESWIGTSDTGRGDGSFTLLYAPNYSGLPRVAEITVSSDFAKDYKFTITQVK